jgi:hypothetical protein
MTPEESSARDQARRALYSDASVPRRLMDAAAAAAAAARAPRLQMLSHAFGGVPAAALEEGVTRIFGLYSGAAAYSWEGLLGDEAQEAALHIKTTLGIAGASDDSVSAPLGPESSLCGVGELMMMISPGNSPAML